MSQPRSGSAELGAELEGNLLVQSASSWVRWVSGLICVAGVLVAGWLTYAHYTTASVLACPETGVINCQLVTTSSYSHVWFMPVALAGLLWFVAMLVLCSPWAWRSTFAWVGRLRMAGSVAGVLSIIWLIYVELFKLSHICLYCTAVHVLTFALFVTLITAWAKSSVRYEE